MPKFSHDNIFYHLLIDFVSKYLIIAFVFFNKFKDFYKLLGVLNSEKSTGYFKSES